MRTGRAQGVTMTMANEDSRKKVFRFSFTSVFSFFFFLVLYSVFSFFFSAYWSPFYTYIWLIRVQVSSFFVSCHTLVSSVQNPGMMKWRKWKKKMELVTTRYPPSLEVRFFHSLEICGRFLFVGRSNAYLKSNLKKIQKKNIFFSFVRRTYLAKTGFLKQSQMTWCSPGIFTLEMCLIRFLLFLACMCCVAKNHFHNFFPIFRLLSFHFYSSFAIVIIIIKCNGLQL